MRAGELTERITLQQNVPTRDEFGAEVPHWSDVATVWAKVIAMSGNEGIAQAAAVVTVAYQITLRYRGDVTSALRVLYEGLTLEIQAVLSSDQTGAMLLQCRQVERGS